MADGLHYDGGDDGASDDYKALASEAFPDEDWTPERIDSLKALIKLCAGESEPDMDDEPDEKSKGLALIFGSPKKK